MDKSPNGAKAMDGRERPSRDPSPVAPRAVLLQKCYQAVASW